MQIPQCQCQLVAVELGNVFVQFPLFINPVVQIASLCVLHDNVTMFRTVKHIQKLNYTRLKQIKYIISVISVKSLTSLLSDYLGRLLSVQSKQKIISAKSNHPKCSYYSEKQNLLEMGEFNIFCKDFSIPLDKERIKRIYRVCFWVVLKV